MDISACRVFPSGAWEISAIVGNLLIRRVYFGYTKKEAIAEFRAEVSRL